ncbi:HAD-IIIC family phosphatase [Duganella aceris]|uniref:HAD-IIIC family phosphatase n=1 Tax=Duganella aceris TaxID=2703883 RepID=A0ABX0FEZ5_9BURK|nr:HAD-IIIC family phosphatase [Duganella aceris]NGZ83106.1 HAD-IIIC family phosphatase [Duganella aceris]
MHPADYLFPRELQATALPLTKLLVIGSCLTDQYLQDFRRLYPEVQFDYTQFNNLLNLPALTPEQAAGYQLQYIQIPLRTLVGDNIIRVVDFDQPGAYEALEAQACAMLRAVLEAVLKHNREHGLLTLVSNFIVPQSNLAPSLSERGGAKDFGRLVRVVNQCLDDTLAGHKHAYVADVDSLASTFGKRFFLDDVASFYSHTATLVADVALLDNQPDWAAPHSGRIEAIPDVYATYGLQPTVFSEMVFRQMESIYRIVQQVDTVKLVIFDLDNTLWRGQIAEHYEPGRPQPESHFWPVGIWEAVQHLRRRGIMVSLCSKNDEHIVKERWRRAVLPWLSYDDFLLPKINWLPKSDNIKDTLATLALTAKSVVFVDDNPVERDEVRNNIPGIRVIGADPFVTRRILLWSAETQRITLGAEAQQREQSYKGLIAREQQKSAGGGRAEFLAGLDVQLTMEVIHDSAADGFTRVNELVNKTNQFNTSGVRWTAAEFGAFFAAGGSVHSFSVRDKFSDYGQVGALLLQGGVIRQFVMSCRVLGMDVEIAALDHVVGELFRDGAEIVVGALVETELNTPCRDVYARAGFASTAQPGVFALLRGAARPGAAHVRIIAA